MSSQDEYWMRQALILAAQAADHGQVPIGACVIADDNTLLGEGFNQPIRQDDPTAHAEIMALRAAGQAMANYRLPNTTMFVTLEPCLMCYGALLHARVGRLVFAASDDKLGVFTRHQGGHHWGQLNHIIDWQGGLLVAEASSLLKDFFAAKRVVS